MPDNRDVRALTLIAIAVAAGAIGAGCATSAQSRTRAPSVRPSVTQSVPRSLRLSSDFRPGAAIPRQHTCDGSDRSPPLRISGIPARTQELVIVMRDHDAPGGDFIHWAMAHISPGRSGGSVALTGGAKPPGAVLGRTTFGILGYRGPCPPAGASPHHYEITVDALAQPSRLTTGFSASALTLRHVLAVGSLTGRYGRS